MSQPGSPALLFDLDGTLVDTDALHLRAYNEVLAELGVQLDAATYQARVMGFPNAEIMQWLLPEQPDRHAEVIERKEAAFRALVSDLSPLAGLIDLLDWADARAIPCAVVTNAVRANADLMLTALLLTGRFRAVILGDELAHGKPHPLPYLTGMQRLGAEPARTVAFEDSRSGIRAAVAAGIACVGITTSLPASALVACGAALTAADFADAALRRIVEETCLS